MSEPTEIVRVLKRESTAGGGSDSDELEFPQLIDDFEDQVSATGVVLQEPGGSSRDQDVKVWRDGGVMWFKDDATPATALTALAASSTGPSIDEFLLDNEPVRETGTNDATYTPTYSGNLVTLEEWKRDDTTLLKSIAYTYSGNQVTSEVRKVFGIDGSTISAQVTWTYGYTGNRVTSATMTRDV